MAKQKTTDYKRAYNEKAYDRLAVTIPKGHKATVQTAAEQEGESINGYVNKAVLARMGLEEWPEAPSSDE
ncbi:hypothetical protein LJC74_04015 [Eubacteriales bacterium OttesenSCG-928-A19]|nr:hypothetical protein [Eubacteriales bacterium OttesenSCG-928-A19]